MSDPRVPADEQIGEPEGVDPELTGEEDNTEAQRRETEEAEGLLEPQDLDDPRVGP